MEQEREGERRRTPLIAWTQGAAARHRRTGRPRAWIGPAGALMVLATFFYFLL